MTNTAAFVTEQSSAVDVTSAWMCEKGHVYSSWACLDGIVGGVFFQYPKWLWVDVGIWQGLHSHTLSEFCCHGLQQHSG